MVHTFFDPNGDLRMERQNIPRWEAIVGHVKTAAQEGSVPPNSWDILDIGCHTGGLLQMFLDTCGPQVCRVIGVEPLEIPRLEAARKMPHGSFFSTLEEVPNQSVNVVVSHEALYLVADLESWMKELRRVLRPEGGAFIVLASHDENSAWLRWRPRLRELYGHDSYSHKPLDILARAHEAGFLSYLSRLHGNEVPQKRFSPGDDGWGEFVTAEEMLGWFQLKYLFTFYPPNPA